MAGELASARKISLPVRPRGRTVRRQLAGISSPVEGRRRWDSPGFFFGGIMDQIEPCANVQPIVEGSIIRTDGTTPWAVTTIRALPRFWRRLEDILETDAPTGTSIWVLPARRRSVCREPSTWTCRCSPAISGHCDATGDTGVVAYKAPAMEAVPSPSRSEATRALRRRRA